MRPAPNPLVEPYRITKGPFGSSPAMGNNGCFILPHVGGLAFFCICSQDMGWEHVSAHIVRRGALTMVKRTPTWEEMCWLKDLFWESEEEVAQYHPARSEYVNIHPYTLHLWRPMGAELPTPPSIMVGPK
jgi:hypothetical protein